MKSILIFIFLLAALTVDVPAYEFSQERLTGLSMDKKVPVVGLSELEKANNALAIVFGRTPPHVEPVIVQIVK